jgi:alanine racemase
LFDDAVRVLAASGVRPRLRHAANSAALLGHPQTHFDLVRPGLALFGVHPCGPLRTVPLPPTEPRPEPLADGDSGGAPSEPLQAELRPVMSVLSQLVSVRDVPVGGTVGYGATWTARRPSRIATLPMGYADGLSRALSNRGHALVRGLRAPIVGVVSMDMTMLDVTDIPGVGLGDEVVLLGPQKGALGADEITASEIAGHTGTIPWEVLTNISRRVPRFYREP